MHTTQFLFSLLPPCVHFSPWKKYVLSGGHDHVMTIRGTFFKLSLSNFKSFQGCLCIFNIFPGISRSLREFAKVKFSWVSLRCGNPVQDIYQYP